MKTISRKAYAKINFCLDVVGRRNNGYHDIRTVMQTVDIYDTLTFEKTEIAGIVLQTEDATLPTNSDNLVVRACELMMAEYGLTGGLQITLEKEIPIAAGMGGGSSDAACAMHAVNELYNLNLSLEKLCTLGVRLGADIPYCLCGGTYLAEGIGEILTKLPAPAPITLLIAKPPVGISTEEIYSALDNDPSSIRPDIDAFVLALTEKNLSDMCKHIGNAMESVTSSRVSAIREIENLMRDYGALKACMSGSGPTVFGIFETEGEAIKAYHVLKDSGLCKQLFVTRTI